MNLNIEFESAGIYWLDDYFDINYEVNHPIGINQLSNVLHVMCDLQPIPSKKENHIFIRNDALYELAKKAKIKYYDYILCGEKNKTIKDKVNNTETKLPTKKVFIGETVWMKKTAEDSHKPLKTFYHTNEINESPLFKEDKDSKILYFIDGDWNWDTLKRITKESFDEIVDYICYRLNIDRDIIFKYPFVDIIFKLSKTHKYGGFEDFESLFDEKYVGDYRTIMKSFLFGKKTSSTNNSVFRYPTPIMIRNGIGRKMSLRGNIYIEDVPNNIVHMLSNGSRYASILDGGLAKATINRQKINESSLIEYISILEPIQTIKKWF